MQLSVYVLLMYIQMLVFLKKIIIFHIFNKLVFKKTKTITY